MKKYFSFHIYVASFILFVLLGLVITSQTADEEIINLKKEKIIALIPSDLPPTYFKNKTTGKPDGFAVDVMDEIAKILNIKVEYKFGKAWDEIHQMLLDGENSIALNLIISPQREALFDFSIPTEITPVDLIVPSYNNKIKSINKDIIIGCVKESAALNYLKNNGYDKIKTSDNFQLLLFDLLSGNIDAALCPSPNMFKIANEIRVGNKIKIVGDTVIETKRAIAFKKGNKKLIEDFNKAIQILEKSSKYQEIFVKWYAPSKPFLTIELVLIVSVIIIIVLTTIMFIWRYYSLSKKNSELKESIKNREIAEKNVIRLNDNLKKSEERWHFALEGSGDGVWDWNPQTNEVYFSPRWKEMLGFRDDELKSEFKEWNDRLHPDDKEEVYSVLNKTFNGENRFFRFEFRMRNKDNNYKWILARGKVIEWTNDGKPLRMIGTHTDVTERVEMQNMIAESEQKYRVLFDTMLNGFALHEIICDDKGSPIDYRFLDINPAFEILTGIKKEVAVGKRVLELMPNTEDYWIKEYGDVAINGTEKHFENYSGELNKYYEVSSYQPKKNQFAVVVSDISERRIAEEKIKLLNKNLEDKNRELEQILYVASHDLRSPLVNVQGFTREIGLSFNELKKIINESNLDECKKIKLIIDDDIDGSMKFITNSITKMDRLLDGILKLSRIGRITANQKKIDMNFFIKNVFNNFSYQCKTKNIIIESEPLPDCIADDVLLDQVFTNLIDNAIKYMKDNQKDGKIKVTGKIDGKNVVYCVEDNGMGINNDHFEKIFELFYRLNPNKTDGQGIGLTIVRKILHILDGNIWLTSDINIGSKFYISLPKG
ncbi:MAG TPA: transporter substrate-binding domain-containing protein [Spirochaetota bacterium]|nr:transporter substrate-binding domain-containing protein [Spirochaetota bacterium]